jgi:hypothetical protein
MAPLISGLLGIRWGVFLVAVVPILTDFIGLSVQTILVNSRSLFTVDYLYHMHVFFQKIVLRRNR